MFPRSGPTRPTPFFGAPPRFFDPKVAPKIGSGWTCRCWLTPSPASTAPSDIPTSALSSERGAGQRGPPRGGERRGCGGGPRGAGRRGGRFRGRAGQRGHRPACGVPAGLCRCCGPPVAGCPPPAAHPLVVHGGNPTPERITTRI